MRNPPQVRRRNRSASAALLPDDLPDLPKKAPYGGGIPFNKQWKLSFGTICQNNGAFFCLKNSE